MTLFTSKNITGPHPHFSHSLLSPPLYSSAPFQLPLPFIDMLGVERHYDVNKIGGPNQVNCNVTHRLALQEAKLW